MNAPLPTTLPDIQRFLVAHGSTTAPWQPARERVDALLTLLTERAHDDRFWHDLSLLVDRLEHHALAPHRFDDALSPTQRGALLHHLRTALAERTPSARTAISRNLSALASFLVLGMAIACGGDSTDSASKSTDITDVGGEGEGEGEGEATLCTEATDLGLQGADGSVYCELLDIVEGADLGSEAQSLLLECFPELSNARRAELLDRFQTASDAELLDMLTNLAYSEECGYIEDGGH